MVRPNRRAAEIRGRTAEALAAWWLRGKLYRILGHRVRTRVGEIDLIARSADGILCFVEIKARLAEDSAAEALGGRQMERIGRAAALYMAARPALRHRGVRFDAILIVPWRMPRHVRDAWRPKK